MNSMNYINEIAKSLKGSDPEFFKRVWGADLEKYKTRLEALGMKGQKRILDAGFGMGQWLVKLAEMNEHVVGIEYSKDRVDAVKKIIQANAIENAEVFEGSIEKMPFKDSEFDAIFCYGVIFCTDYRKSLIEFTRTLKPGGKLYFTANDLGWFLFCLIEEHNKSENYDPRRMAASTILNSMNYYSQNETKTGEQLILNRNIVISELKSLGFQDIILKSEGHINFTEENKNNSFYSETDYLEQGFIFEVHATKK